MNRMNGMSGITMPVVAMALVVGCAAAVTGAAQETTPATVAPVLVRDVKPVYPSSAMEGRQQGRVVLALVVKTDGTVGKVRVVERLSPALDAAAVKAARQWRFKPGTRNGKAVPVETTAEMTFSLR